MNRRPIRAASRRARRAIQTEQRQQPREQTSSDEEFFPENSDQDEKATDCRSVASESQESTESVERMTQIIKNHAPEYLKEALLSLHSIWEHSTDGATSWDDVIGLEAIKRQLTNDVLIPMMNPDKYRGLASAPRGVLFFGEPGCGKTMMARAMSCSVEGGSFVNISSGQVLSQWFGQSEKFIEALFWYARRCSPCIIFLDEAESLFPCQQDRGNNNSNMAMKVTNAFKSEMDGFRSTFGAEDQPQVVVIGATNYPDRIDAAVLSRMDMQIKFPEPDCGRIISELMRKQCSLNGLKMPRKKQLCDTKLVHDVFHGVSGDVRAMQARIGMLLRATIRSGSTRLNLHVQPSHHFGERRSVGEVWTHHLLD